MQSKNKASKLTVKNIRKFLGILAFVLAFIFTALLTILAQGHKSGSLLVLCIMLPIIGCVVIAWLVLFLVFRYKEKKNDPNQQNIKKALEAVEEQNKEQKDEHNS